jgi:hypothetical protein
MANTFANNKKVQLIAANIADGRVFTRASVSKMKQDQFQGKKYGKSYNLYIPGKPKVVNGVVADPSDIVEIETQVFLDNDNVSTTLGPWNRLGDIESFQDEIAGPWATSLVRTQEKKIVANEVFKAMGAVVTTSADFTDLGKATAKLRSLALDSSLVGFLDPDTASTIAGASLNKFIDQERIKKLYGDVAIGRYGTADWVESPDMPEITVGATAPAVASSGVITLTPVTKTIGGVSTTVGFETVNSITGTNLIKGALFTVAGLKMVDTSGVQTDVPVQVIVTSVNAAGTSGTISPLRIAIDGFAGEVNANAWVAAGTTTITLVNALTAGKTYKICEVRSKNCLAYDTYRFDQIPGSEQSDVAVGEVAGSAVQMRIFGSGDNLDKLVRIDSAYAASLYEPREAVVIYVQQ